MKRYNIAALLAALILVLASCASESETSITLADAVEVKYDTAAVVRSDLVQRKQYEAYVKATVESIAFEGRSGTFKKFCVALGDKVKKGDPLAEMDMAAVEEQIAKSHDDIEYKKRKLAYDLEQKQYDIDSAQLDLDSLKAGVGKKSDIELAELNLEKLKSDIKYIKANAGEDIAQTEKSLAELEASLDGSVITAPCDGEVVYLEQFAPGDRIAAYMPVAYVADNSRLYVQYDGSESITSGDRTTALINGKEYDITPETIDQQEYMAMVLKGNKPPAKYDFTDKSVNAKAGDFAALTVYTDEVKDALKIPVNALFYNAGVNYVYLIQDGEKVYTEVTVGLRTDSFVEITDGLKEGDEVFVKQ